MAKEVLPAAAEESAFEMPVTSTDGMSGNRPGGTSQVSGRIPVQPSEEPEPRLDEAAAATATLAETMSRILDESLAQVSDNNLASAKGEKAQISAGTLHARFEQLVSLALAGGFPKIASFASMPLEEVRNSRDWDGVVHDLAEAALLMPDRRIDELVPAIGRWHSVGIRDAPEITGQLSVRAENCLRQAFKDTWGAVADGKVSQLLGLRNFGVRSMREVMAAMVRLASIDGPSEPLPRSSPYLVTPVANLKLGILREWLTTRHAVQHERGDRSTAETRGNLVESALRTIAEWAASEKAAATVADLLRPVDGLESSPPEIKTAIEQLMQTSLEEILDETEVDLNLDDLLSAIFGLFNERELYILKHRTLSPEPSTLLAIAEELGVTRERTRQIETKVEQRLANFLLLTRARRLRWRAATLSSRLGVMAVLDSDATRATLQDSIGQTVSEHRALLQVLVLRMAGPYKERDGWLVRDSDWIEPAELPGLTSSECRIRIDEAAAWLSQRGLAEPYHEAWFENVGRLRMRNEHLVNWSGSVVDKCVALLAACGEPRTADSLVGEISEGHSVVGTRGRLSEDARLMRVSRKDWALRSWGLEEYSGIAEEIAQRIEENGGRARLSAVVDELVRSFRVKENSVRAYAESPMFVIEDGWVRLRREDEVVAIQVDLARCEGVFRIARAKLALRLKVEADAIRGSGRPLASAVAADLGVRPGLAKSFESAWGPVRVTWPMAAATGPTLGSIRSIVAALQLSEGDYVRLDFDVGESSLTAEGIRPRDLDESSNESRIALLTGIHIDGRDALTVLSVALDAAPTAVRQILAARGDEIVAKLLPEPVVDTDLTAALQDLERAIQRSSDY